MSVVVAGLGIWAFFFSPASQAIVDWLQSELTVRNQQIVTLESRADELNRTIALREETLRLQQERIAQGEVDIKHLTDERTRLDAERVVLANEVELAKGNLARTQYFLVHQKLITDVRSLIGTTFALLTNLEDNEELQSVDVWKNFLKDLDGYIKKLPEMEQDIGWRIKSDFEKQCGGRRPQVFNVGKLDGEDSLDLNARNRRTAKVDAAEDAVRTCFMSTK